MSKLITDVLNIFHSNQFLLDVMRRYFILSTLSISMEYFVLTLKQNLSHNFFPCGSNNMYFVFEKFMHGLFTHLITLFSSTFALQFRVSMLSHDKVRQVSSAKSLVVKLVAIY